MRQTVPVWEEQCKKLCHRSSLTGNADLRSNWSEDLWSKKENWNWPCQPLKTNTNVKTNLPLVHHHLNCSTKVAAMCPHWYKCKQGHKGLFWRWVDVVFDASVLQTCPPACCVCVWLVQCTVRRSVQTWPWSPPCQKRRPTCMAASTRSKRYAPKTLLTLVSLETSSSAEFVQPAEALDVSWLKFLILFYYLGESPCSHCVEGTLSQVQISQTSHDLS